MPESDAFIDGRRERAERRIMIVDDDLFVRKVIARAFDGMAEVLEIDDTVDVVAAYLDYLPDIVFMDIHLTRISGITLLGDILSCDDSAHIVIMSSDGKNADAAQDAGAKGFLAKPFMREALEGCFNDCLAPLAGTD